jgi:hypothetical protein
MIRHNMCGRMRKWFICLVLVSATLGAACSSSEEPPEESEDRPRVSELPRPTTGPYVSVAVDNHFHDVHPEDDIQITADRPFVIKNQGRNLHNVTIPGTGIDFDVRPGKQLYLAPVGHELGLGEHTIVCKYHADQGMSGKLTVVTE